VSRSPKAILEEILLVGKMGVREITLLGQNVNSYRWEGEQENKEGMDFPGLLGLIAENIESFNGIRWVRFLSSHPKDFSDEAIRVIAENPCFCRHIHLCVQHGSNRILSDMNRRYTREQYLDLVGRLRSAMPDLSLSTDILVGFPGETEDDLEKTLSLMEELKFLYAFMYHFNPREGTAAYSLPERINEGLKRERLGRVITLQKRHTRALLKSRLGQEAEVLIEGFSRKNADELISRTERDEMLILPRNAGLPGSFYRGTLASLRGNTFRSFI
jgi:tRNA-2-methylthio-N6-dimethylallyladenosine synthase